MNKEHLYHRGGGKPFNPTSSRINRFTDPQMEEYMNPIHGLLLCETGYISNLYFLKKKGLINDFSEYFSEKSEYEEMQKIYEKTRIIKHSELIVQACIEEHGSRIIIPTKSILTGVSLKELGNYIAIKYVNKFRKEKIAVRNSKGNYASEKYNKPEIQEELARVKKSIGKMNQRIPIVYRFFDNEVDKFDDNSFAFHMILFCVWWKADNDEGIDEYYKGIKEVFDIVNTQFPKEPPLEFNHIASARTTPTSSPRASARASASPRASPSTTPSASPSTSPSANNSFEQIVLEITRSDFEVYRQQQSKHFCKGYTSSFTYPDCGEVTARNIINILCYDGEKFDTRFLIEKGAIDELVEYYRVFKNFELQTQPKSIFKIYGMELNARDAWSKLINNKSQTLIKFSKKCDEPEYGFDMMSGLNLDKENPKPNLLQLLNNLMTNVKTWADLAGRKITSISENVNKGGIGIIQIKAHDKKFMVYLKNGHYHVELPETKDEIKYDHITDEKQKEFINILLKKNITTENFIEINFSSEDLENTFNKFKEVLKSHANDGLSKSVSKKANSDVNTLFCLFQLSTTELFDDDLRRRIHIYVADEDFINKLVKNYGNDEIINKYYFGTDVEEESGFGFVSRFPALTVLNYFPVTIIPSYKSHGMPETKIDLEPLENIEHIRDDFLYYGRQKNIDFSKLKKLKTIGKSFLYQNKITAIDFSSSPGLSVIGEQFAYECPNLKTIKFSKDANITSVGQYFLHWCLNLKEINLEGFNLKIINDDFLSRCTSLEKVKFPKLMENAREIGSYFMAQTPMLKTIDMSCFSNVTEIGYAFMEKSGITTIDFSKMTKVEAISMMFMKECKNLKTINLSGFSNVKIIGYDFLARTDLTSIDLSCFSNVEKIGHNFLANTQIQEIDLSSFSNVETIGRDFLANTQIKEIDLSRMTKVKSIEGRFLYGCSELKKVILPPNLASLKDSYLFDESDIKFEIVSHEPPMPPPGGPMPPMPPPGGGLTNQRVGGKKQRRTARKIKKNKHTQKRK